MESIFKLITNSIMGDVKADASLSSREKVEILIFRACLGLVLLLIFWGVVYGLNQVVSNIKSIHIESIHIELKQ